MSGTLVTPQSKGTNLNTFKQRHFVGSFWAQIGVGPVTTLANSDSALTHYWEDVRVTEAQSKNWKTLIKLGYNATTDLVGVKLTYKANPGTFQYREKTNVGTDLEYHDVTTYSGRVFPVSSSAGGWVSDESALNLARQEFYAKARKAQTQLQAGVIAGEAMQTIRGILHTVRTIKGGIDGYLNALDREVKWRRRVTRRRKYSRRETTEWLADQWLSASYGWKPLLSDLDDSMKYLATDTEVLTPDVKIKAMSQVVGRGPPVAVFGPECKAQVVSEERVTATYTGKVSRKVSGFALFGDAMSARAGLDPSNWLPTIWELIPYSFIVDYFSNVQEVVSSYTFNQQSIMWVNRTVRREVKTYVVNPSPNGTPVGATIDVLTPGEQTWTFSSVDRKGDEGPGQVQFELQIPGFGSTKWLNMAALLAKSKAMSPYVW